MGETISAEQPRPLHVAESLELVAHPEYFHKYALFKQDLFAYSWLTLKKEMLWTWENPSDNDLE